MRRAKGCAMDQKETVARLCKIIDNDALIYRIMKRCPYEVLKAISIKRFSPGQVALRRGETCGRFYIVVSGRLAICAISENGKEFTLTTYKRGMFFGELEILEQKPCVSNVRAKTAVKALEVARKDYIKWLEADQNFSQYILHTLCESMYILSETATNNTLYTLKRRICAYLSDNAAVKENRRGVSVTAKEMADLMGVTVRSVNRVFKELRDLDVIEPQSGHIFIKNLSYLQTAKTSPPAG